MRFLSSNVAAVSLRQAVRFQGTACQLLMKGLAFKYFLPALQYEIRIKEGRREMNQLENITCNWL